MKYLPDHVRIIDITAILLAAKRCSFSSLQQKVDEQQFFLIQLLVPGTCICNYEKVKS